MKFGARIEEVLKKAGKTQQEAAEAIGVSPSTISYWKNQEVPPLDGIEKICNFVGIPLYKFFLSEEDEAKLINEINPVWLEAARIVNGFPKKVQVLFLEGIQKHVDATSEAISNYLTKQ